MSARSITLKTVDVFEEPAFTQLLDQVLLDPDRRACEERFFGPPGPAPTRSGAHQVRVGAFADATLVGWSHAWIVPRGVLYVGNSGVAPAFRRQGLYTRLVAAIEEQARLLHCLRIESHHRAANSAVLIAKMKAGFTIVGTEFSTEMGLLVKMSRQLDPRRDAVFHGRVGTLEQSARLFGPPAN